jgi:hypothetical protein
LGLERLERLAQANHQAAFTGSNDASIRRTFV